MPYWVCKVQEAISAVPRSEPSLHNDRVKHVCDTYLSITMLRPANTRGFEHIFDKILRGCSNGRG